MYYADCAKTRMGVAGSYCVFFSLQDVKVFKYYKNLLNFNDKSDPRQMLKSINPAEVSITERDRERERERERERVESTMACVFE